MSSCCHVFDNPALEWRGTFPATSHPFFFRMENLPHSRHHWSHLITLTAQLLLLHIKIQWLHFFSLQHIKFHPLHFSDQSDTDRLPLSGCCHQFSFHERLTKLKTFKNNSTRTCFQCNIHKSVFLFLFFFFCFCWGFFTIIIIHSLLMDFLHKWTSRHLLMLTKRIHWRLYSTLIFQE